MVHSAHLVAFERALLEGMPVYGVQLSAQVLRQLLTYYELLLRWNERLHLVAPCSPEEFATRHVLESLTLLDYLPKHAPVVDVGSGAGLPIIPCLIARPDISATLIESSQKKSVFLREALKAVGALQRATIITKPFEEAPAPAAKFVTCRALDEFTDKLSALIGWAPHGSTLLLFGGTELRQGLTRMNTRFDEYLLPQSQQRFLFVVARL